MEELGGGLNYQQQVPALNKPFQKAVFNTGTFPTPTGIKANSWRN